MTLGTASGCGIGTESHAERRCAESVLADWAPDGRIDRIYPASCLLAAVDALPEDVRSYSSAADDISRALHSQRAPGGGGAGAMMAPAAPAAAPERSLSEAPPPVPDASGALRRPPTPLLALAGTVLVVAAAALAAAVARIVRCRS